MGIRRGVSSTFLNILPGETVVDCGCEGAGGGPGGGATDTGGESGRNWGSAVVAISGSSNRNAAASACSPNEVSVIQARREPWAQEVSSVLSANMVSSRVSCYY